MDIKEIALRIAESIDDGYFVDQDGWITEFAEALIAEIAKQNEHIGAIQNGKFQWNTDGGPEKWRARKDFSGELYTSDQVAAAILKATKPLEEEIDRLESESEEYAQLQSRCFDGGGSHASVFDEVSELRAQLAAAQEENGRLENQVLARDAELWGRTQEILGLKDQLTKAEQRVAEACAEIAGWQSDGESAAIEIRRKFVKEV